MTEKKGTPDAVRHLRPDIHPSMQAGPVVEMPEEPVVEYDVIAALEMLRAPFPAEMIEKLPKPKWKGAWDNGRGQTCPECHGYHVLDNAIHLDYVGHANVTNRLLQADPFWNWEPLAWTEHGTPLFTDKGMWIKLTVCDVTRLGYGDGGSIKEIIGDAIRNAAMRFGVALDLWSKVDLHAERNPGDGQTSQRQQGGSDTRSRGNGAGTGSSRGGDDVRGGDAAAAPARAANQDALDALGSACDEHGLPRTEMRTLYILWAADNERPDTDLLDADGSDIHDFIAKLVRDATAEPDDPAGTAGAVRDDDADGAGDSDPADDDADPGAGPSGDDPASPEEMF